MTVQSRTSAGRSAGGARVGLTPEELERAERVDALAVGGDGAVRDLVAMLGDPSWSVRRAVVAALAALGDDALEALCHVVTTERGDERRLAAAVDALVASTGRKANESVSGMARHAEPPVLSDVASILGRRRESSAVPLLVILSRHDDDNVAVAAIEALGRVGGRAAVDSLVATVQSGSFFRAFPAIDVLGRSGDPRAVAPLAALLGNPYHAVEAARALGRTGDPQAVAPLVGMWQSSDAMARVAATGLAELAARHAARGGDPVTIDAAVRAHAEPVSQRRLVSSLVDADALEQAAICRLLGVVGGEAAIAALTRLLDAPPPVAAAAAEALGRLAGEAEAQLLESLRAGDSARRLVLLPLFLHAAAVPGIVECLSDEDPAVRVAACEALARVGGSTAVPGLFKLLSDWNVRVVQAAVGAIQALGGPETERLALDAARSGWPSVRRAGLRILSYFGFRAALPVLVDALRDPDPRVRDAAVQGLPYIDDARALDELLLAARATSERLRAGAMRSLGQCRGDPRVASYLLKGLGDVEPWVRYYACQSLGRLGIELAAAPIARLLQDEAGQVRVAAIEALSHLRSELAFEALRQAAAAADPDVQRAALVGLGISRRPEAEPLLLAAVSSGDAATRLVGVSAIADLDSPEVMRALGRAALDSDENVRVAAIGFLAGRSGPEATLTLVGLLGVGGGDPERIVDALAVAVEGRVATLVTALDASDDEQAALLVAALARTHRPEADEALIMTLAGHNAAARKAAASAVAAQGSPRALDALRRASDSDADPEVRRIAALLLAS